MQPKPQGGGGEGARGGFTLIEALAAIMVMIIVIPAILQGFTIAGRIATQARLRAEATAIGQSKMDEIIATQSWMSGVSGGDEKVGPNSYHWEPTFESWDSGEVNVQVMHMKVELGMEAGERRYLELTTLVWQPGSTMQSTTGTLGGLP